MSRARGLRLSLRGLLALIVGAATAWTASPAPAQPARTLIEVARPAAEEAVMIDVPPDSTLALDFNLDETRPQEDYPDLVLLFADGARIHLRNLLLDAQLHSVEITFEGITIPAVALAGPPAMVEPPAAANGNGHAPGTRNGDEPPALDALRHTGRDLLFAGEDERPGHPLYSYLLFAGGSGGSREAHARFRAALEAFVGHVSSADALEASGAAREEINIFYAPVTAFLADATPEDMRRHFAGRAPSEQTALLLDHYDRARAEVLLARMALTGNGPYIVSLLRPLSREAVRTGEAFLVQDLSSVPPQLVSLWVDEFKRQVLREAAGSPDHLRRFALGLRTQVAVLAEAFSITKSAVAEMFEPPRGDGN